MIIPKIQKAVSFDVMEDRMVNNFIGSRSLEENLAFLKNWDMQIAPLPANWDSTVLESLTGILPQTHLATIKKMIDSRWAYAEKALGGKTT